MAPWLWAAAYEIWTRRQHKGTLGFPPFCILCGNLHSVGDRCTLCLSPEK
jgi:hypothetical protein